MFKLPKDWDGRRLANLAERLSNCESVREMPLADLHDLFSQSTMLRLRDVVHFAASPNDLRALGAAIALANLVVPGIDWVLGRTNGGLTVQCNLGNEGEAFAELPQWAVLAALAKLLARDVDADYCVDCGGRQFDTPSGITCPHGHGAADSVGYDEAITIRQKYERRKD